MTHFLKCLQQQNDDALGLIDGLEGSGKSTVGFHLANHLDKKWDPNERLIIDYEDWENIYDLESGKVFLFDEGGDLMFSRDSMKAENKLVIRMFQMARIFNHVVIVLCPNVHWVDLYVRDHRALIYGHTHKFYHAEGVRRGLVTWHWPNRRRNWETNEWETRWNEVVDSRFKQIPPTSKKWLAYEQVKRLKVQLRQEELKKSLRR